LMQGNSKRSTRTSRLNDGHKRKKRRII